MKERVPRPLKGTRDLKNTPQRIRTSNLLVRSQVLYPIELGVLTRYIVCSYTEIRLVTAVRLTATCGWRLV